MAAHAKWGPSSMKRLLSCAGSAILSAEVGEESNSSIYAAEGTLMHEVAETLLIHLFKKNTNFTLPAIGSNHQVDGHKVIWDDSMEDAVDAYAQYVTLVVGADVGQKVIHIEVKVRLDQDVWGTADCVVWDPVARHMDVIDLKGGRGVLVEADSDQLLVYALASVETMGYDAITVDTHIVQPRARDAGGNIHRVSRHTLLDLLDYQRDVLNPGLEKLRAGDTTLAWGDHCQFCRAKPICPEIRTQALRTAQMEFADSPPLAAALSDLELAEIMDKAEVIENWIKSVRGEISGRLDRGIPVPNWKLVAKRAVRKWASEVDVHDYLYNQLSMDVRDFTESKMVSVAQFQKRHPTVYAQIEAELVVKESSGTTLVRESDAREAAPSGPSHDFEKISPEGLD